MTTILLLILIEFILLVYAGSREYITNLVGFIVAKMVYISTFAPVLLLIGSTVTNVGTLLYGSVMTAQCIVLAKHGQKPGERVLEASLYVLFTVFILGMFVTTLSPVAGNEKMLGAAQTLLEFSPLNTLASFLAFFISQSVLMFVFLKLKYNYTLRSIIAITIAQIVDSLIFFPIAFHSVPEWWNIMIAGFWLKVALAVIYAPAVYLTTKNIKV